ncbi:3-ketoacyl-coa synthase 7 [Phtheirospermum japonicum]|uniref:3-ketoacyl-CoA synthase n=1 Tax=Phtheirospermum japonicum TaxID=374723 RepID=A0A830CTJ6_9LAMI|nr:3-ketoacyl-coa synthase 7 [Phtheirospermum japonicum]
MTIVSSNTDPQLLIIAIATLLIALIYFFIFSKSRRQIYLIDFSCYRPPPHLRASPAKFIEHFEVCGYVTSEAIDFQTKMIERSGIGSHTCFPPALHQIPHDHSLERTREETETVLFTVVKDLLKKHKLNPKDIDILITNCSIFCPTPSIASMIANEFQFKENIKSVSLSGMGCSAGLVAISLAKDLLRVNKNSLALVLSMEAVTPNGYEGKVKSMLLSNTLFRMGGVAVLLSSKKQDEPKAKYILKNLVRTHMGSDDQSYQCVFQKNDDEGKIGVSLSRSLLHVAANALRMNLIYVPDFKKAFKHFCVHAGGRAVIDAVEERLRLKKEDMEASRMTLYRFGNTSSSSVWYELGYLEAKGRVKRGDRVWQIAFGSGFKCNSAVWECVSEIDPTDVRNAWSDDIDCYPVQIPDIADH